VIAIDKIKKDDLLRVKPGEKIAVDGVITQGESSLDESMISGEPIPVDKFTGDKLTAGSINCNQSFVMCVQKVGSETLLSQIIEMVKIASRSRINTPACAPLLTPTITDIGVAKPKAQGQAIIKTATALTKP
jgi:Cu2+-exporting ATPase